MSMSSTPSTPMEQQIIPYSGPEVDMEQAKVSPSSELTTRPFLGIGRMRSPTASVRSGGIRRLRTTVPRPGPSRRPRTTVEDVADEIGRVIETANITADTIRSEQVAIAEAVVDQTRVETQQAISEVVQATVQKRDLDSHSVHNLLQQLTGVVSGLQASIDQRFDSIDTVLTNERTQTIRNNEDILRGFRRIEDRLATVESRSPISEWGSVRHHM